MNIQKITRILTAVFLTLAAVMLCVPLIKIIVCYGQMPTAPGPFSWRNIIDVVLYAWTGLVLGAAMQRQAAKSPILRFVMRVFGI